MSGVLLGYEIGTGDRVEVPVAHMIVTGQTQQAGKTTALEALVERSGVQALAFLTKRGEGSFAVARRCPPFFRERADWQFVSAILESVTRERMKFERSWIMRATRGARTLADVRRNVRKLQEKSKRSMDADVFMMLGEYLDLVIPVLDRLPLAEAVDLRPGINVVDLVGYPVEVHGLVISSMLSWVHDNGLGVVCVVPEAWKYIPQGRNSPVRMAAVSLAREGAGLRNFLWMDSQDLAGAEKEVVRQASVYLLGVQREANEVKRTLAHIPAGIKRPRADDVATLRRGEFFACFGTRAIRTYACPTWLNLVDAQAAARDNAIDRACVGRQQIPEHHADRSPLVASPTMARKLSEQPEEDEMTPAQEKKLDTVIELLTLQAQEAPEPAPARRTDGRDDPPVRYDFDEEAIYQRFLARLKREAPVVLKVLAARPELRVEVETVELEADGKTLRGKLAKMIAEGFFDAGATGQVAFDDLVRRGQGPSKPNVYRELDALARDGFLTNEGKGVGYKAVPETKRSIVVARR